jgi:hypothetical protein
MYSHVLACTRMYRMSPPSYFYSTLYNHYGSDSSNAHNTARLITGHRISACTSGCITYLACIERLGMLKPDPQVCHPSLFCHL